jgi:hypothetical protein
VKALVPTCLPCSSQLLGRRYPPRNLGRYCHVGRVCDAASFGRVSPQRAFLLQSTSTKMFKPFKPPLLKKVDKPAHIDSKVSDLEFESQSPPTKKRRLLVSYVPDSPQQVRTSTSAVNAPRKPLLIVNEPLKPNSSSPGVLGSPEGYYMVLWYASFCFCFWICCDYR